MSGSIISSIITMMNGTIVVAAVVTVIESFFSVLVFIPRKDWIFRQFHNSSISVSLLLSL